MGCNTVVVLYLPLRNRELHWLIYDGIGGYFIEKYTSSIQQDSISDLLILGILP